MLRIEINKDDLEALKAKDEVLKAYIESVPVPIRMCSETIYIELCKTIIGQLISTKAVATIYGRLQSLLKDVTVDNFLEAKKEDIIACGISEKKYVYIYNLTKDMKYGILDFQEISNKSDEEIIELLTAYPGIGEWSAQMILIHGLRRPNVLAYGDLGIRNGIVKVYELENLSKEQFNVIKERLSPFNTIASLYFWQAYQGE